MAEGGRKLRVVLVPYPFQGHITPMLQLGSILHSKGFSIAIAHTKFNSPNASSHPDFTFVPLSDNLEGYDTSFYNILNAITVMNKNCEASFQDYMEEEELINDGKVACVIYDSIMKFVDVVADRMKVPTIVLRTTTAAYMHSHAVVFQLLEQNIIPLQESDQLQASIPQANPLRFKDLPLSATEEIPKAVLDFTHSYMNIRLSSAVIWNTIESLDLGPLQQLHHHHWPVPFFPIGPLHKMAPQESPTTSIIDEDNSCLSWLDKQATNSVIYVSLGSMAVVEEKELIETARGLANSQQPFLWVVRPSLVPTNNGPDSVDDAMSLLPRDFEETTRGRGLVVRWAPQRRVLAHSAVGGFLTHCGWNSTVESMCEGVPMICRPCFADQLVNARYLTHVWGVGMELTETDNNGDVLTFEESVERGVRKLMAGVEGKRMRERALGMKREAELAMERGGSSYESIEQLVEFIISLSERK